MCGATIENGRNKLNIYLKYPTITRSRDVVVIASVVAVAVAVMRMSEMLSKHINT